jgi:hypothetical protein
MQEICGALAGSFALLLGRLQMSVGRAQHDSIVAHHRAGSGAIRSVFNDRCTNW